METDKVTYWQGRQPNRDANEQGFTLIELLGVIVILAILAGIAVVAVGSTATNSVQASCKADFATVQVAAESFKAQVGSYPNNSSSGTYPSGTVTAQSMTSDYLNGTTTWNGTDWNGVQYLLNSGTNNGNTIGPWMKTLTLSAGHYQIALAADGSGTIGVWNDAASPVLEGTTNAACSSVS